MLGSVYLYIIPGLGGKDGESLGLAEKKSMSSRFSKRACFSMCVCTCVCLCVCVWSVKRLRKKPNINFWPPHTSAYLYTQMHAHMTMYTQTQIQTQTHKIDGWIKWLSSLTFGIWRVYYPTVCQQSMAHRPNARSLDETVHIKVRNPHPQGLRCSWAHPQRLYRLPGLWEPNCSVFSLPLIFLVSWLQ